MNVLKASELFTFKWCIYVTCIVSEIFLSERKKKRIGGNARDLGAPMSVRQKGAPWVEGHVFAARQTDPWVRLI